MQCLFLNLNWSKCSVVLIVLIDNMHFPPLRASVSFIFIILSMTCLFFNGENDHAVIIKTYAVDNEPSGVQGSLGNGRFRDRTLHWGTFGGAALCLDQDLPSQSREVPFGVFCLCLVLVLMGCVHVTSGCRCFGQEAKSDTKFNVFSVSLLVKMISQW